MYSIRVATTDDREAPAAGEWPGLTWERLSDVLRIEISPEAAALFAEPIADPSRGLTHWHIVALEDPKPLHALAPADREKLLARFHVLQNNIRAYADRLAAAGGESNLRLAAGLRAAVDTSGQEAQLWSVAGVPLLTGWGRRRITAAAPAAGIVSATTINRKPVAPLRGRAFIPGMTWTSAAAGGGGFSIRLSHSGLWLFWLPFCLIVATIFYRLLPACSIDLPLLRAVNHCEPPVDSHLADLNARNEYLRRAVFDAEKRFAEICAARPFVVPTRAETKRRVDDAGLQHGRLEVTLAWDGLEDLDLYVYCPSGRLYFGERSSCGGVLDRDSNAVPESAVQHPLEHASWAQQPPAGLYRIVVNYFDHGQTLRPVPFTVLVRDGSEERNYSGVVREFGSEIEVARLSR